MPIRNLSVLALVVTVMVAIDALMTPALLGIAAAFPGALPDAFPDPTGTLEQNIDGAAAIFKLVTMIVFGIWIYRAGRNLIAAGFDDLEFTPAARIWWFFIPIASLIKPFQGMRELWNASHEISPRTENDTLVSVWWAFWLLSNIIGWFTGFPSGMSNESSGGSWAMRAIDIATAVAAILMINRIALAQKRLDGSRLDEVFA